MGELRLYRSCADLSIYAFHKIMETANYAYLVHGWDEFSEVKIDEEKATEIWHSIYTEYCSLTKNNKALMFYKKKRRLFELEMKKHVVSLLLLSLAQDDLPEKAALEYIDEIREWKFNYIGDVVDEKEIARILQSLRAFDNEIGMLKSELKGLEENETALPLTKQVVKVEQILGRTEIDPRKTSVEKWIYMMDEIKEINDQRKKEQAKMKR